MICSEICISGPTSFFSFIQLAACPVWLTQSARVASLPYNHYFFWPGERISLPAPLCRCVIVARPNGLQPGGHRLFILPFFFVVQTEVFHGTPDKNAERSAQVGISQYSFLSKLYFVSQHRCVALVYWIPLGIFNCFILSNSSDAFYELAEDLPFWNIPACAGISAFFGKACTDSSGGRGQNRVFKLLLPLKNSSPFEKIWLVNFTSRCIGRKVAQYAVE